MYGQVLYRSMREGFDLSPVIRTLMEDGKFSKDKAEELREAFLQWIALFPVIDHSRTYVMLKGDVDEFFHAMILNTSLYREFCNCYLGYFVDHHPIEDNTEERLTDGVSYTVGLLEEHYNGSLHPLLKKWRNQLEAGAWVVSCVDCPDDDRHRSMQEGTITGVLPNEARVVH